MKSWGFAGVSEEDFNFSTVKIYSTNALGQRLGTSAHNL